MVAIIHIGVGSNVVCSSGLGNARALVRGTDNRRFHAFLCPFEIKNRLNGITKMKRTIAKCFLQRKAKKTVANDYSVVTMECDRMHFDSFVPKVMLLLVFLSFSFATLGAKSRITDTRYDIEGVETGQRGTYLVKVYVYSKKSSVTTEEFKFAAVHGVLFRGFAAKGFGTQKPIAKPETESQHADFFHAFFNNGDYAAYAQVVNPVADRIKIGKEYKIAATVSISKDELRKTLEGAGIIRSLNSGF